MYVLKKLLYSDIKVINIAASFSSGLYDEDISKVCESLKNKGKILVASNYNTDKRISYLASMKSVIGVGNLEKSVCKKVCKIVSPSMVKLLS